MARFSIGAASAQLAGPVGDCGAGEGVGGGGGSGGSAVQSPGQFVWSRWQQRRRGGAAELVGDQLGGGRRLGAEAVREERGVPWLGGSRLIRRPEGKAFRQRDGCHGYGSEGIGVERLCRDEKFCTL